MIYNKTDVVNDKWLKPLKFEPNSIDKYICQKGMIVNSIFALSQVETDFTKLADRML